MAQQATQLVTNQPRREARTPLISKPFRSNVLWVAKKPARCRKRGTAALAARDLANLLSPLSFKRSTTSLASESTLRLVFAVPFSTQ